MGAPSGTWQAGVDRESRLWAPGTPAVGLTYDRPPTASSLPSNLAQSSLVAMKSTHLNPDFQFCL